jgi:hypothetical protein
MASKSLAKWLKMLWENWGACVCWLQVFMCRCPDVRVPCGEGVRLPFIGQGKGELQVRRTIQLHGEVWPAPPWRWRPPRRSLLRSSHHGASCTRTVSASRVGA